MTILEAGKYLSAALSGIYDQREAANITSLVMEKLTGFSRSERLVHKQQELDAASENLLNDYKNQLLEYKPVQYVLHQAWFCGIPFYVDENVLIPRPETEELVDLAIKHAASVETKKPVILDIGTGSGCISVTIKKKLANTDAYALDISEKQLEIARKNARMNDVKIQFLQADILNFNLYEGLPLFDIIISNPPYIMQSESSSMLPNVLKYEPSQALFVPDNNPLLFYKAITDFAVAQLKPGGALFFEINELMGNEVAAILKAKNFSSVTITKDLQQKNRIVSGIITKN